MHAKTVQGKATERPLVCVMSAGTLHGVTQIQAAANRRKSLVTNPKYKINMKSMGRFRNRPFHHVERNTLVPLTTSSPFPFPARNDCVRLTRRSSPVTNFPCPTLSAGNSHRRQHNGNSRKRSGLCAGRAAVPRPRPWGFPHLPAADRLGRVPCGAGQRAHRRQGTGLRAAAEL